MNLFEAACGPPAATADQPRPGHPTLTGQTPQLPPRSEPPGHSAKTVSGRASTPAPALKTTPPGSPTRSSHPIYGGDRGLAVLPASRAVSSKGRFIAQPALVAG
jgi:hypothetical protein